MRFGIFYEHQLPRPWDDGRRGEAAAATRSSRSSWPTRLGIDYVWEVEHHFLEEYSHSSAPEVFLAAASQRTKNIRLGHGIVQLPPNFNHPARIAERIGDARPDLRTAASTSAPARRARRPSSAASASTASEKRAQWEEALDAITRMFVEEPFAGYDGQLASPMPPRNVVPKPKQKPHPPLWVACSRRETILLAGRSGHRRAHVRVRRARGGEGLGRRVLRR